MGLRLVLVLWLVLSAFGDEMRFPAPEFKSGYDFPATTAPQPTSGAREWVDVAIMAANRR